MDALGRDNPFLPSKPSIQLFPLLWQLELWMREMVYVELRARYADWQSEVAQIVRNWPPPSQANDKRLTHMKTRHDSGISYLSLGELLRIIEKHWNLMESYFPPEKIFASRMSEISQIRHRIAHFRDPHATDLERVTLFLKDLDQGFWRFATAYSVTNTRSADSPRDSVNDYFDDTHDRRSLVEMRTLHGAWRYAGDGRDPRLHFDLSCSMRPSFERNGSGLVGRAGLFYHAKFSARRNGLSAKGVLEQTEHVHNNCVHIRLEQDCIEAIVPSVIGHDLLISTIECFLTRCIECVSPHLRADEEELERLAAEWPEYVLSPSSPLGLLDADMPCSIFTLA